MISAKDMKWTKEHHKLLSGLEQTQKDFWNVARESANFLNMLIKISGAKNAIEVGTSNGYSGIWIAKALKETGGKLTTIEYYEKRINLALANFKECEVDDIITVKQGSACEVLKELCADSDFKIDFAFIDANKGEYIKYFEIIDKNLVAGGIITADNITSHPEKVASFVESIKANENYQVEVLDLPGGMLIARKNA